MALCEVFEGDCAPKNTPPPGGKKKSLAEELCLSILGAAVRVRACRTYRSWHLPYFLGWISGGNAVMPGRIPKKLQGENALVHSVGGHLLFLRQG